MFIINMYMCVYFQQKGPQRSSRQAIIACAIVVTEGIGSHIILYTRTYKTGLTQAHPNYFLVPLALNAEKQDHCCLLTP